MSDIDTVKQGVDARKFFNHLSGPTYVRLLDTPHVWGQRFGKAIMPSALERTEDFKRAVVEIIQKSRYRCDVASLNSPDPAWTKVILEAMDLALTEKMGRKKPTQFRFLFGQTPMIVKEGGEPPNLVDFRGALLRLVRERAKDWEMMPEIWLGKFYRIQQGLKSGLSNIVSELISSSLWSDPEDDDVSTKMTWNHSKIIAVDGAEALVGGHNLNMDLFTSYPPVHDVSVVVHGDAALGSQLYLNRMWGCKSDLLVKGYLDTSEFTWKTLADDDEDEERRRPLDPLAEGDADAYMKVCYRTLAEVHGGGPMVESGSVRRDRMVVVQGSGPEALIRAEDLQTLADLEEPVFEARNYSSYAKLKEYKLATRMLSVGKYWTGPKMEGDYQKASELMKEQLIKGAKRVLRLSQMDLVSAWKKKWSSHVVCHWIMEALLANQNLVVQVVVSPLDAGAGAEGDQYSFGSGACRTYELFEYYMTHDVDTDRELDNAKTRAKALERLHIAPFYFTDVGTVGHSVEGGESYEDGGYKWPDLPELGRTATLKQPPLSERPPKKGIIGSAFKAGLMASQGLGIPILTDQYPKVDSAPGNHSKLMIVDDASYVVGSDNLYPGFLSEFNYLVEGREVVTDLLESYWNPLWQYSSLHCVNPACSGGCKAGVSTGIMKGMTLEDKVKLTAFTMSLVLAGKGIKAPSFLQKLSSGKPLSGGQLGRKGIGGGMGQVLQLPPLLNRHNAGRVQRINPEQPENLATILDRDKAFARKGVEERQRAKALSSPSRSKVEVPSPSKVEVQSSSPSKVESPKKGLDLDSNGDKLGGEHYYTDRQMYRLMQHYIGDLPNVVVLPGIDAWQLRRLEPDTYRDAVPKNAVHGAPLTIAQPYNVNGNHWGLLYIKVDPPIGAPRRKARVLYIDPLNPGSVPDLSPLRRVFPEELLAERCTIRYQDDGMFGQHSCGPWVVCLAQCLAHYSDIVPPAEDNPRTAAIELREMHQAVMDKLNEDGSDFLLV